jgi:hypothetical protein
MTPEKFDFGAVNTTQIPEGYPSAFTPDTYSREPFADTYNARKKALLTFYSNNPASPTNKGFLAELVRLAERITPLNIAAINGALDFVNRRFDCSDFVLLGILRMVLQFSDAKALPQETIEKAKKTILDFKYWPDEPGQDSMCTWTENHQILFSTCEYLAGMMFPDKTFTNSGMSGTQKMQKARHRLQRWLELRFRTGFNEWLSNVYYDEDIAALVTLADFCNDEQLVRGAQCILDLLFYDMSLNSFKGTFGSTHGRSYEREKKSGLNESTADAQKLMFGMGVFGYEDCMSGIHLALSRNYRLPKVIYDIATDSSMPELVNRQRSGIKISEAGRWGLGFKDPDDGMALLGFEAYNHPKTAGLFLNMLDAYNWWENEFFRPFKRIKRPLLLLKKLHLLSPVTWLLRKDIARNMREEVHTLTYRTPDYTLSAALDYKKRHGGDQQHIWQATLSEEAVCFTTHPGSLTHRSPDYWTGSGFLPKVGMHKNVVIAIYYISSVPGVYVKNKYNFTHAWFPRKKFDEVIERKGWIFGKKRDGYIALFSQEGYRWQQEGENKDAEVIAIGKANIWLCEMGRAATHGSFTKFQEAILGAELLFGELRVFYDSPSVGNIRFAWRGGLRVNGKKVSLRNSFRYDNPYSKVEFDPKNFEIKKDDEWLRLELEGFRRTFSSTV